MLSFLSDDVRRNPFAVYDQLRSGCPLLHHPQTDLRLVFDYATVKRVLSDHDAFTSAHGPADWLIFTDPPRHTKLRALISKAFTPKSVTNLEPRIRELSQQLLDNVIERGGMDLAHDYAVQLPVMVIAEMLGVPPADRPLFRRWNDVMVDMSYTIPGGAAGEAATAQFIIITAEMDAYLAEVLEQRRKQPANDLLTRLDQAEVDGERLTPQEMLGFFQVLLLAGSETTTHLITNAILCFAEFPDQLALLRSNPQLLPSAIEEVLRYRSPLQWMYRLTRREVELHGQLVPAHKMVLAVMGAANHDPAQFPQPKRFDITREPNQHLAFGHGVHFCLGASLARLEARIALPHLLERLKGLRVVDTATWQPRRGLHVMGPERLDVTFDTATRATAAV